MHCFTMIGKATSENILRIMSLVKLFYTYHGVTPATVLKCEAAYLLLGHIVKVIRKPNSSLGFVLISYHVLSQDW